MEKNKVTIVELSDADKAKLSAIQDMELTSIMFPGGEWVRKAEVAPEVWEESKRQLTRLVDECFLNARKG